IGAIEISRATGILLRRHESISSRFPLQSSDIPYQSAPRPHDYDSNLGKYRPVKMTIRYHLHVTSLVRSERGPDDDVETLRARTASLEAELHQRREEVDRVKSSLDAF